MTCGGAMTESRLRKVRQNAGERGMKNVTVFAIIRLWTRPFFAIGTKNR